MEDPVQYSLSKKERLYGKNRFERLMKLGQGWVVYPFKLIIFVSDREEKASPVCMAVSVSKKRFKRAVDRNRVKRLTRESYRLNKGILYAEIPDSKTVNILLIYLADKIFEYNKIEKAILGAFKKVGSYLKKDAGLDTTGAH